MRLVCRLAFALAIAAGVTPAKAALFVNSDALGFSFVVDYAGKVNGATTNLIGGVGSVTYTGLSDGGRTYNFNYTMKNDSSVASRLTSWGFNVVNAAAEADKSTGFFGSANLNNNFPEGVGNIEVCFEADANGNCTGGSGGLIMNQTGLGTFSVTFANAMASLTLADFTARFQSINPTINGSSSGVGIGSVVATNGVPVSAPEPTSWLLMLAGFGLIGRALRRPGVVAEFQNA